MRRKKKAFLAKGKKILFASSLIKKATKHVEYLQKQLFKTISEGKLRIQIRYQTLLKRSYHNKILALYKVAQVNTGKKTAGVDGVKIKRSNQRQVSKTKEKLAKDLRDNGKWKPSPAKRILIPKPDGTKRPLGIPTQYDRVVQYILNSILDVHVEHQIHSHNCGTYGFRKHHSTADAVSNLAAYSHRGKHAIVVETDIST